MQQDWQCSGVWIQSLSQSIPFSRETRGLGRWKGEHQERGLIRTAAGSAVQWIMESNHGHIAFNLWVIQTPHGGALDPQGGALHGASRELDDHGSSRVMMSPNPPSSSRCSLTEAVDSALRATVLHRTKSLHLGKSRNRSPRAH